MAHEDIYNKLSKKMSKPDFNLKKELRSVEERLTFIDKKRKSISANFDQILLNLSFIFPELDLNDPNLKGTSDRLARSWIEMISGLGADGKEVFSTSFPADKYDQIVLLKDITFNSLCSHHFLPFSGKVSIGYLPNTKSKNAKVCGLSKLARIVDVYAKRPQLQERMCQQILKDIEKNLKPLGAIVVIKAAHQCMSCRGIEKQGSTMITSALSGSFKDASLKTEFFNLLGI